MSFSSANTASSSSSSSSSSSISFRHLPRRRDLRKTSSISSRKSFVAFAASTRKTSLEALPASANAANASESNNSNDERRMTIDSSSSSSSSSSSAFNDDDPREAIVKRAEELTKLLGEIREIALGSGEAGIQRTLQAMRAIFTLSIETIQKREEMEQINNGPRQMRKIFEALGATYIKFGQFIASAPSAFPKEFVDEFQKCLDEAPAIDFEEIKRIMREDGLDIDKEFYSIDPQPLATASVAQVHAAVLKSSMKRVVVKVLKPGVEDVLKADLSFALVASKVLTFLNPELNRASLVDIVSDLRQSMLEETDFRKEAENMRVFTKFLENSQLDSIATCPYVYSDLSSKRVLVMERLYGSPLTNLKAVENELKKGAVPAINPITNSKMTAEDVLINALNVWFSSVLACETFHADVHAGNLLALSDGRVGFIDFGIVGTLSVETYESVRAFFAATATRDFDKMAISLITMGAAEKNVDARKFANDLREVYKALDQIEPTVVVDERSQTAAVSVDQIEAQNVALKIIQAGEENGVKFPRAFGALLKQILYFDRYITALAPDVSAIDDDRLDFVDAVVVDVKAKRIT
jgi:aarF domain-containing kinase